MARVEITYPGDTIVESFTALVKQPASPPTAPPIDIGLVQISHPLKQIPGPPGPPGPGVFVLDVPPADPYDGMLWWESDTSILWAWYEDPDSGQWVQISGGTGSKSSVIIADTAPEDADNGQLWWSSSNGNLYCRYNDGDSEAWVQVNTSGNGFVTPQMYGARGDGATDDTAAFQAALASGNDIYVPRGDYYLTDKITITNNRTVRGAGRMSSRIIIKATFNLAAQGVIDMGLGESATEFSDIGIYFEQPDTNIRANLIAYPPAIYAFSNPRIHIEGVRIANARIGIDAQGNAGGAYLSEVEIGAYDYATRWAASLDTVQLNGVHVWVFGYAAGASAIMTANQLTIYYDASNVGHEVNGVTDWQVRGGLIFGVATPLRLMSGFGIINGLNFDAFGGYSTISGGRWTIAAMHASAKVGHTTGLFDITGGSVVLTGLTGPLAAGTTLGPIISVANAKFTFGDSQMDTGSANIKSLYLKAGSVFAISNVQIERIVGATFTQPVIDIEGGGGTVGGNIVTPYTGANEHVAIFLRATTPGTVTGIWDNNASGWQTVTNAAFDTINASTLQAQPGLLINGAFQVWQRGVSFTAIASNTYFADRWRTITSAAATATVTRQDFAAGQTDVPGSPTSYMRIENLTGSQIVQFAQYVSDVHTAAGQRVTVKFWARSNVAGAGLQHAIRQNFGSGGSTQVTLTARVFTLTTTWAQYSYSRTLPSISGKTIGTENFLNYEFTSGTLAANTQIEVANAQFEIGDACGPFIQPLYGDELNRCLPYFERKPSSGAGHTFAFGYCAATTVGRVLVEYSPKRRIPSLITSGAFTVGGNAPVAVTNFSPVMGLNGARVHANVASGLTVDAVAMVSSTDAAAYFDINAEI